MTPAARRWPRGGAAAAALLGPAAAAALPAGAASDRLVLGAAALGGAALLALLLALRRAAAAPPPPLLLLVVAVAARLLPLAGPPRLDDDLWRYLWDGRVLAAGISPYGTSPSAVLDFDPRWDAYLTSPEELAELEALAAIAATPPYDAILERVNYPFYPTLYPPASQWLFAGLAAVAPGEDRLLRLVLAVCDLAVVGCLIALLRRLERPAWWALGYAWHPLPCLEFGAAGHQDALGVLLLVAAAAALAAGRRVRCGALLAGAVGVKLFPAAFLVLWARRLGGRGLAAAAAGAAVIGLPLVALGRPDPSGLLAYARRWEYFSGPFAALRAALGGDPTVARWAVALLLAAGLLALRPWSVPDPSPRAALRPLRWLELALVLSPVVDPWYVPWALAPAALRGSFAWPLFATLVPLAYGPANDGGHATWLRLLAWGPFLWTLWREHVVEGRGRLAPPRPC